MAGTVRLALPAALPAALVARGAGDLVGLKRRASRSASPRRSCGPSGSRVVSNMAWSTCRICCDMACVLLSNRGFSCLATEKRTQDTVHASISGPDQGAQNFRRYPRLSSMSAIRFLLSRFCLSPFVLAINCQIGSIFSCSLH